MTIQNRYRRNRGPLGGDNRGALNALLLVNEQLEAEVQELHAILAQGGLQGRGGSSTLR